MQHTYNSQFMNYADQSSRHSAQIVSNLLREQLKIASVLDIGCARGTWLKAWQDSGTADIAGVDGDYVDADELVIPSSSFVAADLARSIDLQRKFDLVQSLEVAEHIRSDSADQFVENLVRHSTGIVLFSAAPPGQGGEFHVNEQPYDYWRQKFRKHGFEAYDYIRPLIADDKLVSFWYRFNILLYVHDTAVASISDSIRAARTPTGQSIPDISPVWFRARKFLIRGLPYFLQEKLARLKAQAAARAGMQ
jgi:hypothetical protein